MLDHLLGDFEVGDHAAAKRTNGFDVLGRLAHHEFGIVADCSDLPDAVDPLHRDDGRLVADDPATLDVNDGVRRPEIDRNVTRRELENTGHTHGESVSTEIE